MPEIRFYHLTRKPLEMALPELLEKMYERSMRTLVRTASLERAQALSDALWRYKEEGFLPHGTSADGNTHRQPIYLTDKDENPNTATTLVLTEGVEADIAPFELVCVVFSEQDETARATARTQWQTYKDAGHAMTYWQQGDKGWEKKA